MELAGRCRYLGLVAELISKVGHFLILGKNVSVILMPEIHLQSLKIQYKPESRLNHYPVWFSPHSSNTAAAARHFNYFIRLSISEFNAVEVSPSKSDFPFLTGFLQLILTISSKGQNAPNTSAVQTVSNPRKQASLICCLSAGH